MRDKECGVLKPKGKKRIAVLGDSFVTGLDVEDKEVLTEAMENLLHDNWEVLNFGVNGFGPTQYFLLLKNRAINYQPDVVIMVIYIRNDFNDILGIFDWIQGRRKPRAKFNKDGEIVFEDIPVPLPKPHDTNIRPLIGLARSHLYNFICQRCFYQSDILHAPPEIRLCKKECSNEVVEAYSRMRGLIKKTQYFCHENNAEFLVVIAPTIIQIYDNIYWNKIKKRYRLKDEEYDLFLPNKRIKQTCENLGIYVLDLAPSLKACASSGEKVYSFVNQHWNNKGNRVAAGAIIDYLMANNLEK